MEQIRHVVNLKFLNYHCVHDLGVKDSTNPNILHDWLIMEHHHIKFGCKMLVFLVQKMLSRLNPDRRKEKDKANCQC